MRITLSDKSLPHQIRIHSIGQKLVVSCNCLRVQGKDAQHYRYIPILIRYEAIPANEAWDFWRYWHAMRGISVAGPASVLSPSRTISQA